MSKVILINGSPNQQGCTYTGLREVEEVLKKHGIDTEMIWVGTSPLRAATAAMPAPIQANAAMTTR